MRYVGQAWTKIKFLQHQRPPLPNLVEIRKVVSRVERRPIDGHYGMILWMHVKKKKVKWSHYRPDVAQRVGRGIALLFHDRGTGRGWAVSSTPRPHFTPEKDPVLILQKAGWAPGPVWTGGKSRPHRDSIQDRPTCSSVAVLTELPGAYKCM